MVIKEVEIWPSMRCNVPELRQDRGGCKHCYLAQTDLFKEGTTLDLDTVLEVIGEMAVMGIQQLTFSGGEPMMWPHILTGVEAAKRNNLEVVIKTNGYGIRELYEEIVKIGIKEIQFALDSPDMTEHDDVRFPGSYAQVMGASEWCSDLNITFCYWSINRSKFNTSSVDGGNIVGIGNARKYFPPNGNDINKDKVCTDIIKPHYACILPDGRVSTCVWITLPGTERGNVKEKSLSQILTVRNLRASAIFRNEINSLAKCEDQAGYFANMPFQTTCGYCTTMHNYLAAKERMDPAAAIEYVAKQLGFPLPT